MNALWLFAAAFLVAGLVPPRLPSGASHARRVIRPLATTCNLAITNTAFGTYAPLGANRTAPLEVTGTVTPNCTLGGAYAITANNGLHSAQATGTCATAPCTRALNVGTSYVSYDLYTDSGHTTIWNATNAISGTGTGAPQTLHFYAYIPPGLAQAAGNYKDTVVATVTY